MSNVVIERFVVKPFKFNYKDVYMCLDFMYPELPLHYEENYRYTNKNGIVKFII